MKYANSSRVDDRVVICPECMRGYEYGIVGWTSTKAIRGDIFYPRYMMPAIGKKKKICKDCSLPKTQSNKKGLDMLSDMVDATKVGDN